MRQQIITFIFNIGTTFEQDITITASAQNPKCLFRQFTSVRSPLIASYYCLMGSLWNKKAVSSNVVGCILPQPPSLVHNTRTQTLGQR